MTKIEKQGVKWLVVVMVVSLTLFMGMVSWVLHTLK